MTALDDERAAHQVCVEMRDTAYHEIKHLAEQCTTLLRENARLRANYEAMKQADQVNHQRIIDLEDACQLALDEATWPDEETPSKIAELLTMQYLEPKGRPEDFPSDNGFC